MHMVQIWVFTMLLQFMFDVVISLKYHGYWYFTKGIDWQSFLAYVFLVPPVNLLFLNYYPFKTKLIKQILYITGFHIFVLIYEGFTLLPEPWGYFHYGWWNLWYSVVVNPFLFVILLGYYKWMLKLELDSLTSKQKSI